MKIGFCGTMSVGKTTLVNTLKKFIEFEEYKFKTERSKYLRDLGIPLNTDSTIKGQTVFLAERAAELMSEKIITDRTVIDVMAFTNLAQSLSCSNTNCFSVRGGDGAFSNMFKAQYEYLTFKLMILINMQLI